MTPFSSRKTALLTETRAHRQKSHLRTEHDLFVHNALVGCVHQWVSLHVKAFPTLWVTVLQGLFESDPFEFMPSRVLRFLGT